MWQTSCLIWPLEPLTPKVEKCKWYPCTKVQQYIKELTVCSLLMMINPFSLNQLPHFDLKQLSKWLPWGQHGCIFLTLYPSVITHQDTSDYIVIINKIFMFSCGEVKKLIFFQSVWAFCNIFHMTCNIRSCSLFSENRKQFLISKYPSWNDSLPFTFFSAGSVAIFILTFSKGGILFPGTFLTCWFLWLFSSELNDLNFQPALSIRRKVLCTIHHGIYCWTDF